MCSSHNMGGQKSPTVTQLVKSTLPNNPEIIKYQIIKILGYLKKQTNLDVSK